MSDTYSPAGVSAGSSEVREAEVRQASVGELTSKVTTDLSELVRKEIELAKVEVREESRRAGRGAGMLGGGGFAAYLALFFLSVALMFLLNRAIATDWAAFVVGMFYLFVAVPLILRGRRELKTISGAPQTVETVKEDAQWAANRTK
jgi:uncharacterized membrane protein YqjE